MLRTLLGMAMGLLCCAALAAPQRVAFNADKPPYAFFEAGGRPAGIEIDVLRQALTRMGHQLVPVALSKARLEASVKAGQADIGLSVQGKDGDGLYYSEPFSHFANVAISRKADRVKLDNLNDLEHYRFVIWQGGWNNLGPAFAARYKPDAQGRFPPNYVQSSSQELQVRAFWHRRVQVIVVDRTLFEWYRRQLSASMPVDDELVVHDIFDSTSSYGAVFADKALRDRFNQVLKEMVDDGSYAQIMARYK